MTGSGIAAIQSRMADLATLVSSLPLGATSASGSSAPSAASSASSASADGSEAFAAALSDALGASSSGADGLAGLLGDTGLLGASGLAGASASSAASAVSSAAGSGLSASGEVTGQDLVNAARAYIGVPYVWGGESLAEGGLDCSGLVQRSLADLGVTGVPRVARDQAKLGTPVASLADARPGDLLVFEGGKHIGIYVGDGQMIDAPRPGKTVQQRAVFEAPTTIRRILPAEPGSGTVTSGTAGLAAGTSAAGPTGSGSATDDVAAQRALVAALLPGVAA